MSTLTTTRLERTSPILDGLALKLVNDGQTPEQILDTLKASNYIINVVSKGRCQVDGITVANIARGIILARTTMSVAKKSTRTRARKPSDVDGMLAWAEKTHEAR